MDREAVSTISIRTGQSGLIVEGPTTFRGGHSIPDCPEPDGIFAEWTWDGNRLEARVDRLGMFPLYYCELPNGIAISTRIDALLEAGASREIDWVALQVLFGMGFHVGCDTSFRAIKVLPVGGRLSWISGKLEVTEKFPDIRPSMLSRPAALEAYVSVFRAAIRKRIVAGARIRLPLSGGRDSRHILLELVAADAPPECCYTSSFATMHNDVLVAKKLCSALGVHHAEIESPKSLPIAELMKNVSISCQALDHGWLWPVVETIADPDVVSYDGLAGDVLSAGLFQDNENSTLYRSGRFEDLARKLVPRNNLTLMSSEWKPAITAADPRPSLIRELRRYEHTHNPMVLFYLYNRSRRAVSVMVQAFFGLRMRTVFTPYLDRDVFDFLTSLPESMFVDKMFHTEAITKAFPEMDAIGYARKTPILHSLYWQFARQGLKFVIGAGSTPLLDRKPAMLRLVRALTDPRHAKEARWVMQESVMLYQLGRLIADPASAH